MHSQGEEGHQAGAVEERLVLMAFGTRHPHHTSCRLLVGKAPPNGQTDTRGHRLGWNRVEYVKLTH